jgi:hypothetical protein
MQPTKNLASKPTRTKAGKLKPLFDYYQFPVASRQLLVASY